MQARTLNRRLKREVSALEVDFQSMEALEPAFEGVSSEYKRRKVEHVLTKVTQSATELLNVGRQLGMKCNSGECAQHDQRCQRCINNI
jgi:hypothetical protein